MMALMALDLGEAEKVAAITIGGGGAEARTRQRAREQGTPFLAGRRYTHYSSGGAECDWVPLLTPRPKAGFDHYCGTSW